MGVFDYFGHLGNQLLEPEALFNVTLNLQSLPSISRSNRVVSNTPATPELSASIMPPPPLLTPVIQVFQQNCSPTISYPASLLLAAGNPSPALCKLNKHTGFDCRMGVGWGGVGGEKQWVQGSESWWKAVTVDWGKYTDYCSKLLLAKNEAAEFLFSILRSPLCLLETVAIQVWLRRFYIDRWIDRWLGGPENASLLLINLKYY